MQDWAYALSIRAYARRHIGTTREHEHAILRQSVQRLTKRLRKYSLRHKLDLVTEQAGNRLRLKIVVRDGLAGREARIVSRLTRRLLSRAPAVMIALQFHEISLLGRDCIRDLVEPLRRYADRITVESDLSLLPWLDSSVFRIATINGP